MIADMLAAANAVRAAFYQINQVDWSYEIMYNQLYLKLLVPKMREAGFSKLIVESMSVETDDGVEFVEAPVPSHLRRRFLRKPGRGSLGREYLFFNSTAPSDFVDDAVFQALEPIERDSFLLWLDDRTTWLDKRVASR